MQDWNQFFEKISEITAKLRNLRSSIRFSTKISAKSSRQDQDQASRKVRFTIFWLIEIGIHQRESFFSALGIMSNWMTSGSARLKAKQNSSFAKRARQRAAVVAPIGPITRLPRSKPNRGKKYRYVSLNVMYSLLRLQQNDRYGDVQNELIRNFFSHSNPSNPSQI